MFFCFNSTVKAQNPDTLNVSTKTILVDTLKNVQVLEPIKNIRKKYKGKEFDYSEITDKDRALSIWERFLLWLSDFLQKYFKVSSPQKAESFIGIMMRVIGFIAIIFVLYKIVMHLMNENGNWIFGRKSDDLNPIKAENLDLDINKSNFKDLISNALQSNNYRLAIRYYYLMSLKKLSEKSIIEWDKEKTNYDYYSEIKKTSLKKQFQYISYIYDYCWYGKFEMNEKSFAEGKMAFEKMITLANNE